MHQNFQNRPQTSKYRNQSHFQFGDQNASKQLNYDNTGLIRKRRPQSYRNISKIAQFMNDTIVHEKNTQKVRYLNVILNTDKYYEVPKRVMTATHQSSYQFQNFFQKNGSKLYKPVDQFSQYTGTLKKNSALLRRGQFNLPVQKQQFSVYKRSSVNNSTLYTNSKYYTTYKGAKSLKLGNSISASLGQSIKQKKNIRKQKEEFRYNTQKYIKPVNKTFLGHANQYEQLLRKQRQNNDKVPLKNAMSRVLTMQVLGKQMSNLTKLYI